MYKECLYKRFVWTFFLVRTEKILELQRWSGMKNLESQLLLAFLRILW